MDRAARFRPAEITRDRIPEAPGVYAWYRRGKRVYVGKAASLRDRLWANHLGQSKSPTSSAFRRNVAEELGFGSSAELKARKRKLTPGELEAVRRWIMSCELTWLVCATNSAALTLESSLKAEFKPPLTKR